MIVSTKIVNSNISIVVPALNAEDYLPSLLESIEAQTLLPQEIVVIDSSPSSRTANIIEKHKGSIPIVFKRVDFAYPGHARNLGVKLAKSEWVAFIDCRTIPGCDWLKTGAEAAKQSGAEYIEALCLSSADTSFKKILQAATYGCEPARTLPGSMILKRVFEQSGGFIPNVRAGEDLEWIHRCKTLGVKINRLKSPTLTYNGFPESLSQAMIKWFNYAIANADIEIKKNQKSLYLLISILFVFFSIYNWNHLTWKWNHSNIYYIPNITKIFVVSLFSLYIVYRGIFRSLKVKVKLSFLFPLRWLEVGFVGLCLDLAKAPGLVWGAIRQLQKRIRGK